MKVYRNEIPQDIVDFLVSREEAIRPYYRASGAFRRSMGYHGNKNVSNYNFAKKWEWPTEVRKDILNTLPHDISVGHNEVWYLDVPAGGNVDLFAAPNDSVFDVYSICLSPDCKISFYDFYENEDGVPDIKFSSTETFQPGDVVSFSLKQPHEIEPAESQQLWLVMLFIEINKRIGIETD